jgi:hypothetical protein
MKKLRGGRKPESVLQSKIVNLLKIHDWFVKQTHGNMFQSGLPDLYCCHSLYGARWIEVKMATGYRFTPAQILTFPEFAAKGVGVWVLTEASEEQYKLLFKPANWHMFLEIMKEGYCG